MKFGPRGKCSESKKVGGGEWGRGKKGTLARKPPLDFEKRPLNGKKLSNVDCATLLGVEIDSKLSFNEHIEKVCKKILNAFA